MAPYIGCKIIDAVPAKESEVKNLLEGAEDREGYRVTYASDYVSWSPKDVFEEAYRLVSLDEAVIIGNAVCGDDPDVTPQLSATELQAGNEKAKRDECQPPDLPGVSGASVTQETPAESKAPLPSE